MDVKTQSCAVVLVAWLAHPLPAQGQNVRDPFAALASTLPAGTEVIVRTSDRRKAKGDVLEITGSSLTLRVRDRWGNEERRQFDRAAIRTIRRNDSQWNGLLLGLAAGLAAAETWRRLECGPRGYDDECSAILFGVGVFTMVPGGAVAGALIDRFHTRLLYRSAGVTMNAAPVVRPRQASVVISLAF